MARARLAGLSEAQRAAASSRICNRLTELFSPRGVQCALAYVPLAGEPDVRPWARAALASGMRLALPLVDWARREMSARLAMSVDAGLETGCHGVQGPPMSAARVPLAQVDAIVVPGLAFDPRGGRLGRGGGFYDRLLAEAPARTLVVGVCFDVQVVDRVPREAHDRPVHRVVTERRMIEAVEAGSDEA